MRTRLPGVLVAVVLSALLAAAGTMTALGYIGQPQTKVLLSGSNTVKCNRTATVTAKVVDVKSGKPVWGQIVTWSLVQTQSGGDSLSAGSSKTNRKGNTSVNVSFGPVAGARMVRASIAGTAPTITVQCAGGLPKTAPVPPAGYVDQPSGALLAPPLTPAFDTAPAGELPATAIRMDRLGIELPLVEGDGYQVPLDAAAHYPGTAWPGQGSNTYVYAHARDGYFLNLWQVRTGDLVELDMADGSTAAYRVSEIHPVVKWDALEYLAPTDSEILTLQTCLTYADTAPRFVVIAERVTTA